MSKRRKRSPLFAIALLLALGVAAAAAWFAAGGRLAWPGGEPASEQALTPSVACTLVDGSALASRLADPTTAIGTRVPDGVPAGGACELLVAGNKLALVRFDGPSLARMRPPIDPQGYFDSLAVGLEYEFKAEPEVIAGLGTRAVAGGFGDDGDGPAQIVWQRGGVVLVLAARERMPRERMLAVARAIDATAP
jgi:hypothetical protein